MAATTWTGPAPDEFADFEAASRPRYRHLSVAGWLRLAGEAVFLVLLAVALVRVVVWTHDNRPDRLFQGTWATSDHPQWQELKIIPNGHVFGRLRTGESVSFNYAFKSRATVSFSWGQDPNAPTHRSRFRLHFEGRDMVMQDLESGARYRFHRQE